MPFTPFTSFIFGSSLIILLLFFLVLIFFLIQYFTRNIATGIVTSVFGAGYILTDLSLLSFGSLLTSLTSYILLSLGIMYLLYGLLKIRRHLRKKRKFQCF